MVVCEEVYNLGSRLRGIKKWGNQMEPPINNNNNNNNHISINHSIRLHFSLWILALCILIKIASASRVPPALLSSSSSSSSSSLLATKTTTNSSFSSPSHSSSSSSSSQSLNSKSHSSSHSKQKKGSSKKNGKQYRSPPAPKHAPTPTPTPTPTPMPTPTPALAPPPPSKPKNDHHMGGGDGYYYPSSNIFDVLSFGAQGDGETDDTEAFMAAWEQACQVESSVFEVPAYFVFVVGPVVFSGPCAYNIVFQIDGTIKPLGDANVWGTSSKPVLHWLEFAKVNSLILQGDGVVDGTGDCWWSLACKAKAPNGRRISRPCESPTAIRFFGSYNVTVRDVVMRNSPQMHLKFDDCVEVMVDNVTISSPSNSPNTDGIHVQNTQSVDIRNSLIQTGDDCISIQTGCSNVEVQNVVCVHGHGISIGGLGQEQTQACVSNISVHDVLIQDSQNGLRIKTWQGGSGSVKNVDFRDIQVRNTSNPIIIDQYYCDAKSCKNQTSAVHVNGVTYNNIKGTYWRDQPVRISCSDSVPCTDIILSEVELLPENGYYVEDPFCWNSYGVSLMPTIPPITCLQDGLPLQSQPLSNADSC